jgi:hypothetical protein
MSNATLQMSLDEYNAILGSRTQAEQERDQAFKELAAAKLVDPSGYVPKISEFARDCLTIARFAIANLPPEMIRGWPYQTLRKICETINVLPDYTADDRDMALDLLDFAQDCEDHDIRRRAEPKATKMTPADVEEHRKRLEADPIAMALMHHMQTKG